MVLFLAVDFVVVDFRTGAFLAVVFLVVEPLASFLAAAFFVAGELEDASFFAAAFFVVGELFFAALLVAVDFVGVDFLAAVFAADFVAVDFVAVDFFAVDFFAAVLVVDDPLASFLAAAFFVVGELEDASFFAAAFLVVGALVVDFAALLAALVAALVAALPAAPATLAPVVAADIVSFGSFLAPETTFFRSAPALNFGTAVFLARIRSPVRGLRTMRASRTRFSNDPKPVMATFSPLATSRVMVSRTDSRACAACLRFPSNRVARVSMS